MSKKHFVKDALRIAVYGGSGSGKSTFVKNYIKNNSRLVVFDTREEYDVWRRFDNLIELKNHLAENWGRGFRIGYTPPPELAGREPELLHKLSVLLRHAQEAYAAEQDSRKITLVVEEMDEPFPVYALPKNINGFTFLCRRGRHYGIEIIGVTQRPSQVAPTFRGNCTQYYYFRVLDATDIATIAKTIGKAKASRLLDIKPHHYIAFGDKMLEGKNKL